MRIVRNSVLDPEDCFVQACESAIARENLLGAPRETTAFLSGRSLILQIASLDELYPCG